MKTKIDSEDPDIIGSYPALRRAARAARCLARRTGTPLFVLRDGKVVNLNPRTRKRPSSRRHPGGL